MFPFCSIYSSCVLLYNVIIDRSKSPTHNTPPKPSHNKNPVLLPDKTGNNRHTPLETSNTPISPVSSPTNPSFQTFSNETADPSPDKTGNNRKIKLNKLNLRDPTIPLQEKALG
jgi:hypothetical protein